MNLAHLTADFARHPAIAEAIQQSRNGSSPALIDFPDAATPAIIAAIATQEDGPVLVVTTRRERADYLTDAIAEFMPPDTAVAQWASPDALPYEQLPVDLDASVRRVQLLGELRGKTKARTILVTSVYGLMPLITPPDELERVSLAVRTGDVLSVDTLYAWASRSGYETAPVVQEPGTIARRGGIVDLFPPGSDVPVRLDFFGDDLESIRTFDPHTQRSIERINRLVLSPPSDLPTWRLPNIADTVASLPPDGLRPEVATEWARRIEHIREGNLAESVELFAGLLVPEKTTLLDHLPPDTRVIVDQLDVVRRVAGQVESQARDLVRTFVETGELPPGLPQPYVDAADVLSAISDRNPVRLGEPGTDEGDAIVAEGLSVPPSYVGNVGEMTADLQARLQEGWAVTIATDQVDRLTDILEDNGIYPRRSKLGKGIVSPSLSPGTTEVRSSNLTSGWMWDDGRIGIWTDFEVFGFRKQARRGGVKTLGERRQFALSLVPGEYVVHIDHGVARFTGLRRIEVQGIEREYLVLEYERGDKLNVPVDQSDRVSRYSAGGLTPNLNRLGSGDWMRTKRRVRRAVRDMAYELIQLYAHRDGETGFAFPPDSRWDHELAESFPFVETIDQAKAIEAVSADMERAKPMDRLVCGDVGFGKTEVAIRAAFKAVNAGRQVAMLVPTTVLALQHFTTFRNRLAAFPVRVEMLSRLRSKKEQDVVLDGLREGAVDIVIGTHRLVQNDVKFKDLGLVVIDEEQRFGVRHKEFLKQVRTEVDVLTMSATPIPRTLHLSMSGIRDISLIETAPQARLPIRTFVTSSTDELIREVILRELDRGGQVFVVHNRVHDIDRLANRLRKAVPEARFGIGHGQMDEHVLEEVMLGFVRRDFDVLIATTIIESGVDIPNVNTIIIDNADTLGLTQLYQLRGRVGRSTHRAYAYLLHQPHKVLSIEAMERLEAIQEATELGAGLRVAMRDLEIRGAGNILGAEQSGHIATVGYELYVRLLAQAVEEIRSGKPITEQGPVTLDLPMTALIPDDYIADTELRLNVYRQIASIARLEDIAPLEDELRDRFGDFPVEVEHLFSLIGVRIRAGALGIDSVVERDREIVIRPVRTDLMNRDLLVRRLEDAVRITPNSVRIRLLDLTVSWQDALDTVLGEAERVHHQPSYASVA